MNDLLNKYSVAGPRYTSYPPVPCWTDDPGEEFWKQSLVSSVSAGRDDGVSLYIHLPFCESLCTYCGCNTRITVNHAVEEPYIEAVLGEWKMYRDLFGFRLKISEIHLGGGTPTFFSAANLDHLLTGLLKDCNVSASPEFSIEGHPSSTNHRQMKVLSSHGFRRISYGIQDFNPVVQKAIHRFQSPEKVEEVTRLARENGFESVNYDLIYGLPFQSIPSITATIKKVIALRPDRIAYYGYAHVPWVKPGQRKYSEKDLPSPEDRLLMYETGRNLLEQYGYVEIGMDHFALPTDSLFTSMMEGKLNRNFMGYTNSNSSNVIGLGVSSISENEDCYVQNVKVVEEYYERVAAGRLPVFRGHRLTKEDKRMRVHIKNLMCRFETRFSHGEDSFFGGLEKLREMEIDGLVEIHENRVRVTDAGRRFVRNVCMAIDPALVRADQSRPVFSNTI
jgi:oxygen-independent coproporphyrinogen III oxidase